MIGANTICRQLLDRADECTRRASKTKRVETRARNLGAARALRRAVLLIRQVSANDVLEQLREDLLEINARLERIESRQRRPQR